MNKKVLIFVEDLPFRYDNRVQREARALTENGWEVTVIAPKNPNDSFYTKLNDNLRCYHYPKPTAESALGHIVEHSLTIILGSILTAWVAVRHGFKVFHACNPMDIFWIIALPYLPFNKKFIFDQHDLCPELYLGRNEGGKTSLFYRTLLYLEKMSYKMADVVISTNESYKKIAMERGGKAEPDIFVVRNGPDLNRMRILEINNRIKSKNETLVGYLGNMNPQDGVNIVLDVASYTVNDKKRQNLKFVLIGGGSSQAKLARQSEQDNLGKNVIFTGRISDQDMLEILNECDICLQPDPLNDLNDKSTMNKVMEYMALAKPVVAFDLKETRVSGADAALYATANDYQDMAEKILYLVDNPEEKAAMGTRGRERILNTLAWKYSVPNLLAAYERAVQKT